MLKTRMFTIELVPILRSSQKSKIMDILYLRLLLMTCSIIANNLFGILPLMVDCNFQLFSYFLS